MDAMDTFYWVTMDAMDTFYWVTMDAMNTFYWVTMATIDTFYWVTLATIDTFYWVTMDAMDTFYWVTLATMDTFYCQNGHNGHNLMSLGRDVILLVVCVIWKRHGIYCDMNTFIRYLFNFCKVTMNSNIVFSVYMNLNLYQEKLGTERKNYLQTFINFYNFYYLIFPDEGLCLYKPKIRFLNSFYPCRN